MANDVVLSSFQDSRGFLWFGTANGLSRYDGYAFKTYVHARNNPNSLINNYVTSILEAPNGVLWITTQGGITSFDPDSETFSLLGDSTPVVDSVFFTTFIDSRGEIWFGGGRRSGIVRYQPDLGALTHIPILQTSDRSSPIASVHQIVESNDGTLWMAAEGELIAYDAANDTFRNIQLPDGVTRNSSLLLDSDDQLWLGTSEGLVRFDPSRETFTQVTSDRATDVHYLGADGLLWVSTADRGFAAFDIQSETFRHSYQHHIEWEDSIGFGSVNTVTVDRFGVFWIGTDGGGVSRFDPHRLQFGWYGYTPIDGSALPHPNVTTVEAISETRWLVGTSGGLTLLDLESGSTQEIGSDELVSNGGAVVFQDAQKTVWVAIQDRLNTLDLATGELTPFPLPTDTTTGRGPNRPNDIHDITEADDGSLLLAVRGLGALKIDPARETVHQLELGGPPGGRSGPPGAGLPATTVFNSNESVWVGYFPPFVTRYDLSSGDSQAFDLERIVGTTESFQTFDIYEDAAGIVWLATTSGLLRLDPVLDELRRIETLPTDSITSISADRGGNLWLGSTHGLLRYRLGDGHVTQFGREDGLPSSSFNERAAAIGSDGHLLLGTNNGLVAFYADRIRPKTPPAPPIITDIQLFNESIPIDGTLLNSAVWNTEGLTLAYNQNTLSFEFSAGGYTDLDNLRYRYRMNGLEESWSEVASDRRYVTFGQLPPGSYTFELQTGTPYGDWNEQSTILAVDLIPAWWQRTSIQIGAVALLFGLVAVSLWQRSVRLKQRNDELAILVDERTRDLADSETRFRHLAGASFEAILVHDDGEIIDANAVAADLLGIPLEQLIGRTIETLNIDDALTQQLLDTSKTVWEVDATRPDGRPLVLEGRSDYMPYREHTAQVTALRDVTERREREVERQHMVTLEERERIGRDLHDDLGQMMGYLSVQAQTARQQLRAARQDSADATLQQLADVSREAHNNIRRYILGIRSEDAAHTSINLPDALQLLAQRMRERHALDTTLTLPSDLNAVALADEVEAQLLRIVQEALTNIVKHAETDRAQVFMTIEEKVVRVVIADEGRGFVDSNLPDGHFGLHIMQERAESVNGTLQIESIEGKGTQVTARLPHLQATGSAEKLRDIRILVVDDHPLYLDGLTSLLATRGLNVVGTARDGVEAETVATQLNPDLILMDIDMPNHDGLEATRRIHEALPNTKIVMLTVATDEERLLSALRNGASGYLLKSLEGERFFAALADVMQGETVLSPSIASRVLADIANEKEPGTPNITAAPKLDVTLTARQLEVLRLVAQGMSNKEIGQALHVSIHTVKFHIHRILDQLPFENRHQLARYARESGIVN